MVFRKIFLNYPVQLSMLLFLTFIAQIIATSEGVAEKYFLLETPLLENPWTILTNVFAHADTNHLTANIIGLLTFGIPIALKSSKAKFYAFFIITGMIAAVTHVLAIQYIIAPGETTSVLGASGGIFALLGYLITSNRISQLLPGSSKIRYPVYIVIAVWITFATANPETALIAHFTGLLLGLIVGRKNLLQNK